MAKTHFLCPQARAEKATYKDPLVNCDPMTHGGGIRRRRGWHLFIYLFFLLRA